MLRAFHLMAKNAVRSHPDWNGCTADRACEVWADGGEARARELAHGKFWQEATPVKPDRSSPWTDPDMVACEEVTVPADSGVPAAEAVFHWDQRIFARPVPSAGSGQTPAANQDPSKKLDQR